MTKAETAQVLFFIKALYPSQFNKMDDRETAVMVDAWHRMLKDYSVEDAMNGAETFAATDRSGFCPSVGQLIDCIRVSDPMNELTAEEAWARVWKAIVSLHWESPQEDFDKLPETARKVIGSASELKRLAYCDERQISNEKARFIRAYNDLMARARDYARTPIGMSQHLQIGVLNEEE